MFFKFSKTCLIKGTVIFFFVASAKRSARSTICRAAEALRSQGAIEVHAACSHGLFTGGAIARLLRYVDGVHATGSLSNPRDVISGGPALARGVNQLMETLELNN